MSMTIVVTVDVAPRFRGFLASCMLELAPGVYTAPRMTRSVRDRIWQALTDWHGQIGGGGIVMTWRDTTMIGGQAVRLLGNSPKQLYELDGLVLTTRPLPNEQELDTKKT